MNLLPCPHGEKFLGCKLQATHHCFRSHSNIYSGNLQNPHCLDNDDLHKSVYLYNQIENFCTAIDSILLPSFAAIDVKSKIRVIYFIIDGMTECHDMGCDLMKSLEGKYSRLGLRRLPPPAGE